MRKKRGSSGRPLSTASAGGRDARTYALSAGPERVAVAPNTPNVSRNDHGSTRGAVGDGSCVPTSATTVSTGITTTVMPRVSSLLVGVSRRDGCTTNPWWMRATNLVGATLVVARGAMPTPAFSRDGTLQGRPLRWLGLRGVSDHLPRICRTPRRDSWCSLSLSGLSDHGNPLV